MSRHVLSCLTIAGFVAVLSLATGQASAQRHPIVQTGILCEKIAGPNGGTGTAAYGPGGLVTNSTPASSLTVACPVVQSALGGPSGSGSVWVLDRSFGQSVTCTLSVFEASSFSPSVQLGQNSAPGVNQNCQRLNFGFFMAPANSRVVLSCTIPGPGPGPFSFSSGVCAYRAT